MNVQAVFPILKSSKRKGEKQMHKLIIQTKDLTKTYGEQTVVDHVNLHVRNGKIYGLLGRNGAGKTTIMKMMMGRKYRAFQN